MRAKKNKVKRSYSYTFGIIFKYLLRGIYKIENLRFFINNDIAPLPLQSMFLFDMYEYHERALIKKYIKEDDSVLEFGGSIGVVACFTNKLLRENAKHVVVECYPKNIGYIEKHRIHNECDFIIELSAISHSGRNVEIFKINRTLSSGMLESEESISCNESQNHCKVPGHSLNYYINQYGNFSALIVDIEGAEVFLLESERELLTSFRIIIIEFHPELIGNVQLQQIYIYLLSIGFSRKDKEGNVEVWKLD